MSNGHDYLMFALGIGAGVATGMLFGPKSGAEMRRALGAKAQQGAEYLSSQTKALKASPAEMVINLKDFWLKHRDELQEVVRLGKRFYEEVVEHPRNGQTAFGD